MKLFFSAEQIFQNTCLTHNELQEKLYELDATKRHEANSVVATEFRRCVKGEPEEKVREAFEKLTPEQIILAHSQEVSSGDRASFIRFHEMFGMRVVDAVKTVDLERATKIAKANLHFFLSNVSLHETPREDLYRHFCEHFKTSANHISEEDFLAKFY